MRVIHSTSTGKKYPTKSTQKKERTKAKAKPLPGYKKRPKT